MHRFRLLAGAVLLCVLGTLGFPYAAAQALADRRQAIADASPILIQSQVANARLQAGAAAQLLERIGPTVALTNSAGGLRALLTAIDSEHMAGIVMYENVGFVFPQGEWTGAVDGPFGPVTVPLDDFLKLTGVPMQVVWGDNVDQSPVQQAALEQSRQFVDLINEHGGRAEFLMLRDAGLVGNTHLPFADLNNVAVADLLSAFLDRHDLDAYHR